MINTNFQEHIRDCYKALNLIDKNEKCFISRKKLYTAPKGLIPYLN